MWTVRTKDRAWKANQNWLLGEHGASLFLRLSHMAKDRQTRQIDRQDRQTQGRMRVIVMLCQNDSFDLLSFSPQPLTEGLCHLDEFRPTNKLKCPLLQLYPLTPCLPASPLVSPLVCLSVSLHLLLSVCWSNSNKSVPPPLSPPSAGDSSVFTQRAAMSDKTETADFLELWHEYILTSDTLQTKYYTMTYRSFVCFVF